MLKNLLILKNILGKQNSRKIFLLIPLFLISALLETVSVGLIVPLVSILTDDSVVRDFLSSRDIFIYSSDISLKYYILGLFLLVYLLKSTYSILFFYFTQKFFSVIRGDLHTELYNHYLNANYEFHLQHNRSALKRNIDEVGSVFTSYLSPLLLMAVEVTIMVGLISMLLITEPKITMFAFLLLSSISYVTYFFAKPKFTKLGRERVDTSEKINRHLYQGLGAIKEIKILKKEKYFSTEFSTYMRKYLKLDLLNSVYSLASSTFIEVMFIISAISLMFFVLVSTNLQESLPVVALFALASIRILQSIKKSYLCLGTIAFAQGALELVSRETSNIAPIKSTDINLINIGDLEVDFKNKIDAVNIGFKFQNSKQTVLDSVSIDLPKNSSIAIIGESGSGKTTLVNIFLGLLELSEGHFLIDGNKTTNLSLLKNKIGYVPQNVYITDDSIASNIAFGIKQDDIDYDRVSKSLKLSSLFEFASDLPDGLDTILGEDGARMSGGQRQRLGIARALYNDPDIIVLDEVTASLDGATESAVMDVIYEMSQNKTIVIITHKLNTIKSCDKIYLLGKGKIQGVGNYEQLYSNNQDFKNLADNY